MPWILLVLCVLEVLFFPNWTKTQYKSYAVFFSEIVMLNAIHGFFFIPLLISTGETRRWILKDRDVQSVVSLCLVFLLSAVVYASTFKFFESENWVWAFLGAVGIVSRFTLPTYHAAKQSYGLLSLYNKKAQYKSPAAIERACVNVLILMLAGSGALIAFAPHAPFFDMIRNTLLAVAFLSLVVLLAAIALSPKSIRRAKVVFAVRFLFFPLSFLTPSAPIFLRSIHGLESILVWDKIHFKKDGLMLALTVLVTCVATAVVCFGNKDIYPLFFGKLDSSNILYKTAAIIGFSVANVHYYIDHRMYGQKEHSPWPRLLATQEGRSLS